MVSKLYELASPAPRNKNVWSDNFPPTNFKAATSPAKTTDAVPWNVDRIFKIVNNEFRLNGTSVISKADESKLIKEKEY